MAIWICPASDSTNHFSDLSSSVNNENCNVRYEGPGWVVSKRSLRYKNATRLHGVGCREGYRMTQPAGNGHATYHGCIQLWIIIVVRIRFL